MVSTSSAPCRRGAPSCCQCVPALATSAVTAVAVWMESGGSTWWRPVPECFGPAAACRWSLLRRTVCYKIDARRYAVFVGYWNWTINAKSLTINQKILTKRRIACLLAVIEDCILLSLLLQAVIIGSKSLTLRGKNGLHAFGNNSAESEPIWMKSEKMWAKYEGLALADVWRDPRSSDSLRGIVFPKKAKSAHKISRSCHFRPS